MKRLKLDHLAAKPPFLREVFVKVQRASGIEDVATEVVESEVWVWILFERVRQHGRQSAPQGVPGDLDLPDVWAGGEGQPQVSLHFIQGHKVIEIEKNHSVVLEVATFRGPLKRHQHYGALGEDPSHVFWLRLPFDWILCT